MQMAVQLKSFLLAMLVPAHRYYDGLLDADDELARAADTTNNAAAGQCPCLSFAHTHSLDTLQHFA